jgi:hypothetical protein
VVTQFENLGSDAFGLGVNNHAKRVLPRRKLVTHSYIDPLRRAATSHDLVP